MKKNYQKASDLQPVFGRQMTSIEIAEVTGKLHKDVMRAIRNMEPAWEKVNGRKFALVEYKDKKGEVRPCYQLSMLEFAI